MTDFKEIYLQPTCCADNDEVGRLWCQDPDPEECEEGVPWTRYVRADLLDDLHKALDFYDRVLAAPMDEQIAVGRDHHNQLMDAVRSTAKTTA